MDIPTILEITNTEPYTFKSLGNANGDDSDLFYGGTIVTLTKGGFPQNKSALPLSERDLYDEISKNTHVIGGTKVRIIELDKGCNGEALVEGCKIKVVKHITGGRRSRRRRRRRSTRRRY